MKIIEAIRDLSPLLIALVWPTAILIILLVFRKGIEALLASLRKAQLSSNMFFEFGEFKLDARGPDARGTEKLLATPAPKQAVEQSGAKWGNVANVFWLGGDLHWTAQIVLRGSPKERIFHGLRQAYHHISELGYRKVLPERISLHSSPKWSLCRSRLWIACGEATSQRKSTEWCG